MPIIDSAFRPAWWLPGAHAQTLWPALFRRRIRLNIDWERLELDDGDFLDLAWSGPHDAPTVLLFHGLQGGLGSHYIPALKLALQQRGYRTCLMLFRGRGREPNRLPISYHSGKTDDAQRVLEHIIEASGRPPFAAVGVSLGGNMLLKWLGEQGDDSPLERAVAASIPFRLDRAAKRLDSGLSRLYQKHLIDSLVADYRAKFSRIVSPLDIDPASLTDFYRFDDQVTAPLHGFAGADDYYRQCSSRQFIPRIRVPTLIVHARNDPFVFPDTPPEADELPENVWLEIPQGGGHVGFVGGRWPGLAEYYLEQRVAQWIASELPAR